MYVSAPVWEHLHLSDMARTRLRLSNGFTKGAPSTSTPSETFSSKVCAHLEICAAFNIRFATVMAT